MTERDIKHENGSFWVLDTRKAYAVMRPHGAIASESDSAYARTDDGLSIAVARCDYLARQAAKKATP
jgi:hypothetical protein